MRGVIIVCLSLCLSGCLSFGWHWHTHEGREGEDRREVPAEGREGEDRRETGESVRGEVQTAQR